MTKLERRIIEALQSGQMHKRMLCNALDMDYQQIDDTMAQMLRAGTIVILGTARQAGYTDTNAHSPIYGLPGMTLRPVVNTKRKANGSGVFPTPCRERPFTKLTRDPFVLRDLALTTRKP